MPEEPALANNERDEHPARDPGASGELFLARRRSRDRDAP